MWLMFALVSTILLAVRRIYEKELSNQFGNFSLSFVLMVFSLLPTLALFLFFPLPTDILHLPWDFWWPLLVIWLILYPIQTYFLYRSIREGELSQVTPVTALLPVLNIATSFLIIGEIPTGVGFAGIFVTVFATYLLLTDVRRDQGRRFNVPVLLMLGAMVCWAMGSTLDKIAISVSTPVFYTFVNLTGASLVMLLMIYISREQSDLKKIPALFWKLSILGILFALAFFAFASAFALGPTSYTLAIRSGGFLVAVLWGIFFLKESLSRKKIAALVLFVAGTALLAIA